MEDKLVCSHELMFCPKRCLCLGALLKKVASSKCQYLIEFSVVESCLSGVMNLFQKMSSREV